MNKPAYDLQHQVQAALMNDRDIQDHDTLRGIVPTREARDRAEEIARGMDGVVNVINELDVA